MLSFTGIFGTEVDFTFQKIINLVFLTFIAKILSENQLINESNSGYFEITSSKVTPDTIIPVSTAYKIHF